MKNLRFLKFAFTGISCFLFFFFFSKNSYAYYIDHKFLIELPDGGTEELKGLNIHLVTEKETEEGGIDTWSRNYCIYEGDYDGDWWQVQDGYHCRSRGGCYYSAWLAPYFPTDFNSPTAIYEVPNSRSEDPMKSSHSYFYNGQTFTEKFPWFPLQVNSTGKVTSHRGSSTAYWTGKVTDKCTESECEGLPFEIIKYGKPQTDNDATLNEWTLLPDYETEYQAFWYGISDSDKPSYVNFSSSNDLVEGEVLLDKQGGNIYHGAVEWVLNESNPKTSSINCISKTATPTTFTANDNITYTITYTIGENDLESLIIKDSVTTGFFESLSTPETDLESNCSYIANTGEITCNPTGTLLKIGSHTIMMSGKVINSGTIINNVTSMTGVYAGSTVMGTVSACTNTLEEEEELIEESACLETSPRSLNIRVADLASKSQELTTIADIGTYTDVEFKWIASAGTLSNSQWHDSSGTPADGKVTDAITWTAPATASADSVITITAYIRPEGSTDDTGLTSDACKLEANITALDLVCNWLVPNNSYTSAPFDMTFSADIAGDEGALFTYDLNFGDGSTHYTGNGTVASGTTIELPYVPPQTSPHTYTSLSSAISPSLTVTNTETGETSICPTVLSGLVKPPVIVQPHTGSSSSSTIYLIILGVVSIAGGLYAYNTQVGALYISKLFNKKERTVRKANKKEGTYEKKVLQTYEGDKK